MKKCAKCCQIKELEEFPKDKRSKDGKLYYCKECYNASRREYLDKDRDRARQSSLRHYYKYQDILNAERREKAKYFRLENKEEIDKYAKAWRTKNIQKIRKRAKELRDRPEAKKKRNEKRNHLNPKDLHKIRARKILQAAVRVGHFVRPTRCDICLKSCKPEGHHDDYSKPLKVRWLCRICHNHRHKKLLDVNP